MDETIKYDGQLGKIRDEENTLAVNKLMPESLYKRVTYTRAHKSQLFRTAHLLHFQSSRSIQRREVRFSFSVCVAR